MNKVCIQTIQVFAVADIQSLSHVWLFATPQTAAHQASMSFTIFWSLLKLMSIESVIPPNHVVLCHPFLLLPSIFPSNRGFSNDSALCIRWLKYWSFSFIVSPSNEYLGLIEILQELKLGWSTDEDQWVQQRCKYHFMLLPFFPFQVSSRECF